MLYKLIYDLAKYNNKNLYLFSNKIKKYNLNYLIEHYGIIKKNTYNKNILYRNDNFEIILISWDKNICTNIHRHPENGCIMNILDGCLKEEIYKTEYGYNNCIKKNTFKKGDISYIHDSLGYHKIYNKNQYSYSLHIYSPPNFYNKL